LAGGDAVRSLLQRRAPDGSYVIPVRNTPEARAVLEEGGVEYEEAGDMLLARLRSRAAAKRLALQLAKRGLLAEP